MYKKQTKKEKVTKKQIRKQIQVSELNRKINLLTKQMQKQREDKSSKRETKEPRRIGGYEKQDIIDRQRQLALFKAEQKIRQELRQPQTEERKRELFDERKRLRQIEQDMYERRHITGSEKAIKRAKIERELRHTKKAKVARLASGAAGSLIKGAAGAFKAKYKMSKSLLAFSNAFGGATRGGQTSPGRPRQVYVHRSPFSGRPIPATLWYKEMRLFRRLQQDKAENIQKLRTQQLAARGVPPQQAQAQMQPVQQLPMVRPQLQMARPQFQQPIRQPIPPMVTPQQLQQQAQQLPNGTIIPRGNSVWKFRRGVVGTEGGLMGRQQKVYGLPESFWN